MRDDITYVSNISSDNLFDIKIYGLTPLKLYILNKNGEKQVLLNTQPNFECYSDCTIFLKFDNEKMEKASVFRNQQGNSLFFENSNYIFDKIKNSKNIIIEVPIFINGLKQYKFKTEGYDEF